MTKINDKRVMISETIFSECSYGDVKVSFDNSAAKFLPEDEKVFPLFPKKETFKKKFLKELSTDT